MAPTQCPICKQKLRNPRFVERYNYNGYDYAVYECPGCKSGIVVADDTQSRR